MAFCINCGKELAEGAKFCYECGQAVCRPDSDSKRETAYEGKLHKCPECGEIVNSFEANCPSCGHEFRGLNPSYSAIKELSKRLIRTKSIAERERLIRNFYIPNTKEDITEFVLLATSNLKADDGCDAAWMAKLEQIYKKAQLSFGGSLEFEYVEEQYKQAMSRYQLKKKRCRRNEAFLSGKNVVYASFRFIWVVTSGFFKFLWQTLSGTFKIIKDIIVWVANLLVRFFSSEFFKTALKIVLALILLLIGVLLMES